MIRTVILTTVIFFTNYASAQKALSHSDYDNWKYISNVRLSSSGNYVAYSVEPQKGDGLLYVQSTSDEYKDTIERARPITCRRKSFDVEPQISASTFSLLA